MFEQLTDLLNTIDRRVDAKMEGARQEIRREATIDALTIVRDVVLPIIHDALTARTIVRDVGLPIIHDALTTRIDQLKQQ